MAELTISAALAQAKALKNHFKAFEKIEETLAAALKAEGAASTAERRCVVLGKQILDLKAEEVAVRESIVGASFEVDETRRKAKADWAEEKKSIKAERDGAVKDFEDRLDMAKGKLRVFEADAEKRRGELQAEINGLNRSITKKEAKIAEMREEFA